MLKDGLICWKKYNRLKILFYKENGGVKVNNYPEYILQKLRQRERLNEDDTIRDTEFNQLSKDEVFHEVLSWEGLGGSWDSTIKGWIMDIYGIDLDHI